MEKKINLKLLGFGAALISLVLMGCYGPFVRLVSVDETVIALFRFVLGLLFLTLHLILSGRWHRLKVQLTWPLVLSGIVLALGILSYTKAIRLITLAQSGFLLYLAPLIASLLGFCILREQITLPKVVCILVSFFGSLCLLDFHFSFSGANNLGRLFGLGSAICYAVYILLNRLISSETTGTGRVFYQFLFGSLTMLVFVGVGDIQMKQGDIWWLLGIGFFQGYVALSLLVVSLRYLQGHEYATISYIEPVVAALAGYFIYGETLTFIQTVGCLLILLTGLFFIHFSISMNQGKDMNNG